MKPAAVLLSLLALLASGCGKDEPEPPGGAFACQGGAWRIADGTLIALTPVDGGMRYRLLDGRTGRLQTDGRSPDDELEAREGWREDGPMVARARFEPCPAGRMHFALADGPQGDAVRLPLREVDTVFSSEGLQLRGRLVLPAETTQAPAPLAVLVHGSERFAAVGSNAMQYLLPAQGVAAFVYDKRGTGGSTGEYTQDFHALSGDAVAALAEARRLHPAGFPAEGFVGASQGGWVAPLAASRTDVDYVVALYGLAENPLAEDREQVMNDLRAKGHGEEVLAQAREVTDATARLMASGFTSGFEELEEVRRKYGRAPWFGDIEGEFSGQVLRAPAWLPQSVVRMIAARHDVGTTWDYEPVPVLEQLAARQLWVVAGEDLEAPNVETLRRIRALQAQGRPVDLAVFPDTDHGMLEFDASTGTRVMLRHADGYFALVADWIRDPRVQGPYGRAQLELHAGTTTSDAEDANSAMPAP
jgi:dienelactone hydrolase